MSKREDLLRDGFCTFEGVLTPELVARLQAVTDRLTEAQSEEDAVKQRTTGSMISTMSDPAYVDLITWPAALEALAALGYERPSFSDGWVISKPGHSPRLFWHYDWFTWQDQRSYDPEPMQLALMYYLSDTRRENGCLRVVPGSHREHNPLHDVLLTPRRDLTSATDLGGAEFENRPDEVDVPVRAGDLLITDARLLHAAHENRTDERRSLITLWYQPDLASLPDRMQAQMAAKTREPGPGWPAGAVERLAPMLTRYDGGAEPYEWAQYRRRPEPARSRT